MVIIGASPFIIDMLTVTGKFIARPIKSFNRELVAEFDEKMKKYVKTNFAVEDPNALLAERLPNGEPGLIGIIFDKESSVKDVTSEMNILGWDMTRLFTLMVFRKTSSNSADCFWERRTVYFNRIETRRAGAFRVRL